MLEEAHHLELPEDPLRADEALEHVGQLLERDPLPVARVGDGPDDAESAVPDRTIGLELGVGVACKNDEISIQVWDLAEFQQLNGQSFSKLYSPQ